MDILAEEIIGEVTDVEVTTATLGDTASASISVVSETDPWMVILSITSLINSLFIIILVIVLIIAFGSLAKLTNKLREIADNIDDFVKWFRKPKKLIDWLNIPNFFSPKKSSKKSNKKSDND